MSGEEKLFMSMQSSVPEDVRDSFNYQTECSISIVQCALVKGSLRKHVVYTIEVTNGVSSFNVCRRYKEFLHMRKLLRKTWPGCYIPQVPPKKLFGNRKEGFIEKRQKLLQSFLVRVTSISFLYQSEVFQLFLTYEQSFLEIQSRGYDLDAISEVYKKHFSESFIGNNKEEIEDAISKSTTTFQESIPLLKALKKAAKQAAEDYSAFAKYSAVWTDGLRALNGTLCSELSGGEFRERQGFVNPYHLLIDWTRAEELDIEAIIESIEQKFEFDNLLARNEKKLRKKKAILDSLNAGQMPVLKKITNSNREVLLEQVEHQVEDLSKASLRLREIASLINSRLARKDIPRFKEKIWQKYRKVARAFLQVSGEEFTFFAGQFALFS